MTDSSEFSALPPPASSEISPDPSAAMAPDTGRPEVQCWRCGKCIDESAFCCPFCEAPFRSARSAARAAARQFNSSFTKLFLIYGAMLLVSVLLSAVARASSTPGNDAALDKWAFQLTLGADIVDTLIVLVALAWIGLPTRLPAVSSRRKIIGWVAAGPVLAVLLAANFGYHYGLREYIGLPEWAVEPTFYNEPWPWVLLLVCVQPAIIEELFFRYLALNQLHSVMGIHAVVFVSSIMFGFAHIGVPLSIPILTLVGVGIGYVRVISGSLPLAMIMHGLHNLAVVYLNHR